MYRALRRWKGTKLQEFSLTIHDDLLEDDAHAWTLFALKNKVQDLELCIYREYSAIPQDLYTCSSIRTLSLCCNVGFHGTPSWNQLESLTLKPLLLHYNFEDFVNQIMLGSPVLEVLDLDVEYCDDWENLNIMSTSLKWLYIASYGVQFETPVHTLSICCPNLETLEIRGLCKCLLTDVSSLSYASIGFSINDRDCGSIIESLGENLNQIFSTIQNVEELELTDLCVQVFGASHKKYILSPLPNVKFLKRDVCKRCIEIGDVIVLLGIFPNLKYFKIGGLSNRKPLVFNTVKYMEFEINVSKSFLLQLKEVVINAHLFDSSVFGFIEFLLKHAVMLEKLVIWSKGMTFVEYKKFSEKLLSMPRSSPTARVILKSD